MTGFELRTCGVWSNWSANWATTTAQQKNFLYLLLCSFNNWKKVGIRVKGVFSTDVQRNHNAYIWLMVKLISAGVIVEMLIKELMK